MISTLIEDIKKQLGDYNAQIDHINRDIREAQDFACSLGFIGRKVEIPLDDDGTVMYFDPNRGKKIMLFMKRGGDRDFDSVKLHERIEYHKHLPKFLDALKNAAMQFMQQKLPADRKADRKALDPLEPDDLKWNQITTKKTKGMY